MLARVGTDAPRQIGHADDGIQRGTQLMADVGQKGILGLIGEFGGIQRIGEFDGALIHQLFQTLFLIFETLADFFAFGNVSGNDRSTHALAILRQHRRYRCRDVNQAPILAATYGLIVINDFALRDPIQKL